MIRYNFQFIHLHIFLFSQQTSNLQPAIWGIIKRDVIWDIFLVIYDVASFVDFDVSQLMKIIYTTLAKYNKVLQSSAFKPSTPRCSLFMALNVSLDITHFLNIIPISLCWYMYVLNIIPISLCWYIYVLNIIPKSLCWYMYV